MYVVSRNSFLLAIAYTSIADSMNFPIWQKNRLTISGRQQFWIF